MSVDLIGLEKHLSDQSWRLNNLYTIVDKEGKNRIFKFNWAQRKLYEKIWYSNIVLKARQLGISTFVCLLFLDNCLFKPNVAAGIIAHTREDAEHMFKRIKFAYDQLPDCVKDVRSATVSSARELVFNNNSSLRVGTSMRGSTLQYLHISEFGKICAHWPDKAREIVTGSLNAIGSKQYVFIESTAEGKEGYFYDLCKAAESAQIQAKKLSPLDYRFHFFPWYDCPDYAQNERITIPKEIEEYFDKLYQEDIELTAEQKSWYYSKLLVQKDDMKREYPSTPSESFESAIDGSFYAKWIRDARFEGRVGSVPWDRESRVSLAFDPGYLDSCAVVFFQCIGQEIHIIDYYENSGEGLSHYLEVIKKKPYIYDRYFGPHDIESHHFSTGLSTKEVGASLGVNFITLQTLKLRLEDGIEAVRGLFPRIWIDEKHCSRLIKCIENYRKEFDVNYQIYKSRPVHDQFSHGADALRYACIAIKTHVDSAKGDISDAEADRMYNKYHPLFN
jgi:hypothetical protein